MPDPSLALLFVRPLNRLGSRYFVSGSVASILYGEPRLTIDVDIVAHLRIDELPAFRAAFPAPEYYVPPTEILIEELSRERKGHFNVIHADTGFKADFYPASRDELHAWAFRRTHRIQFQGEEVVVAPPEYVILRKLEYFREGGSEKHVRDIRSMLAISGELIDHPELEAWVRRRGLDAVWNQCRG
jgi:hypothetical protein